MDVLLEGLPDKMLDVIGGQGGPLTVIAILVFGSPDGSIRVHLQEETLLTEETRHNSFELRLWNTHNETDVASSHIKTSETDAVLSWISFPADSILVFCYCTDTTVPAGRNILNLIKIRETL